MNIKKITAGVLVFGSLWGFSEVIIGAQLDDFGIPSGMVMTGFFALSFLVLSRLHFQQPGMQLGIGLVAGTLRIFNPFGGCQICSAIAIMAEAALFEVLWYKLYDIRQLNTFLLRGSMGIVTTYSLYVGGYIVTQILTPLSYGRFMLDNLIAFIPQILAGGLFPALLGGLMLPLLVSTDKLSVKLKEPWYYPTTLSVSLLCWIIVLFVWFTTGA